MFEITGHIYDETLQGGDNDRELLNVRLTYTLYISYLIFFLFFSSCVLFVQRLLFAVSCTLSHYIFYMNYLSNVLSR
jgi:hypothetical protein